MTNYPLKSIQTVGCSSRSALSIKAFDKLFEGIAIKVLNKGKIMQELM